MNVPARLARAAFSGAVAISTACHANRVPAGSRQVRDSAGVALVTLGVPDTIGRRWTIRTDSALLRIGGSGGSVGVFGSGGPASSVELPGGRIAVSVNDSTHIRVFDHHGTLIAELGRDGEGPGEFPRRSVPQLATHADSLIASDERGGVARVSVFDASLRLRRNFVIGVHGAAVGSPTSPNPIGALSSGQIVYQYGSTPDSTGRAPLQLAIAPRETGDARVVIQFDGEERVKISGGGFIRNTYLIFGKLGAATVAGDQLVTGSNDGFTFNVFDASGHPIRRVRIAMKARPVTHAIRTAFVRDEFMADTTPETRHLAKLVAGTEHFAKTVRFYDKFIGTRDGGLWIERARTSDADEQHFWIFDSSAHFLAAITLPADVRLRAVWGDTAVVSGEDPDGTPYLALDRIVGRAEPWALSPEP